MRFVKVVIGQKSDRTDKEYTYAVPNQIQESIAIGSQVIVPFGKGNRLIEGFVVDILEEPDIACSGIKFVQQVVGERPVLSAQSIALCRWMREMYSCRWMEAIQCVSPAGFSVKVESEIKLTEKYTGKQESPQNISIVGKKILQFLNEQNGKSDLSSLKKTMKSKALNEGLKELKQKGLITMEAASTACIQPVKEKVIQIRSTENISKMREQLSSRARKQREIIAYLEKNGPTEWSQLREILNVSMSTVQALKKKGFIEIMTKEKWRKPYQNMPISPREQPVLTKEQLDAQDRIIPYIQKNIPATFLIHGVTGSGKTEVYIQLIMETLKQSKEAILLLPEIALTTQMIEIFKGRFGEDVAILHSRLSLGERYDEWRRIREGRVKIAIGARSAVFAPFEKLGLIVIDEEHEYTYKSEHSPKYHAIEVAEFRCHQNNAVLVMGSATPSIESYTKALKKRYQKIDMKHRYNENPLPNIEIIDMRKELNQGNKSIFSRTLYQEIELCLEKKKQAILFLNRRGYATFISCRNCGYVLRCPNCEIALTYHAREHKVSCHYCGFFKKPPTICPECSSKYIKYFGIGTEKIERLTQKYFPQAKIGRLDLDTTSRKGMMEKIIADFKKKKFDILIGTQMIAKGLDFPDVTLVGVIAADSHLNLPDFRAAERTFQLITQVSGRAGRGESSGKVIVQTYAPEHYAIVSAKNHDYDSFYRREMMLRKEFFYPPYSTLFNILFTGVERSKVIWIAQKFESLLKKSLLEHGINPKGTYYGPHAAAFEKIKRKYRWQLIVKSKPVDQNAFKRIINNIRNNLESEYQNTEFKSVNIIVDTNPYSML